MQPTLVQHKAIEARMAVILGADRLFPGIEFCSLDNEVLYVFAKDEDIAAEIEEKFEKLSMDSRRSPRNGLAMLI
jgi:hypothetical protein